ncbi:hypothetical protein SERLADRAFT_444125 [Serpula lacrymans var. lacrymans S7.9]|uniref:Uncharacterized protein n=1 Tax=Serpula lacrymans var. lacrymans (strain S7.9) TaxID=578457 RepID=F8PEK6_SERL9|nr:uncharacterized protein SERLADRAFT_444125 [Serpula lacrymans var. lacrymans S7.9]EGO18457.1 hypothetical protein SERLADRAFT_444125 [Serpula lacrymans var. lacrymans S7.9]
MVSPELPAVISGTGSEQVATGLDKTTIKFFLDHVTSQLKGINLANVKQTLLNKGHIRDGRWATFKSGPAKSKDNEEISSTPLTDVIT